MAHKALKTRVIWFLPLGDESIASSRLRCYKLVTALNRKGLATSVGAGGCGDILFVQKRTDAAAMDAVRSCKRAGGKVVFDIDDFPGCPEFRKNAQALMSLADAVTTATPEQADLARKIFSLSPNKRVFCLPNPADYELDAPVRRQHVPSRPLRVVWFGNAENYPQHLVEVIAALPDTEFHAITNASDELRRESPLCHFHTWSYDGFSRALTGFDLCVLSHEGSEIANAKSDNKMVTAILHGVPVIASRTPDYQRLARSAGVERWLYDSLDGLQERVELMRSTEERNGYLAAAQGTVWRAGDIATVADLFLWITDQLDK